MSIYSTDVSMDIHTGPCLDHICSTVKLKSHSVRLEE